MAKEHISFKNERVISVLNEAKKTRSMSKFVEDAIIFYLDNMGNTEDRYTTKEDVKSIIIEYLGQIAFSAPTQNKSYKQLESVEDVEDDIKTILSL